jgi:putative endonuclease
MTIKENTRYNLPVAPLQCYVYIMTTFGNTSLYTGMTNDLIRRVYEHKHHLVVPSFTDKYHTEKLVYYEVSEYPRQAIEREKQLKGWRRSKKLALIKGFNPEWRDLYFDLID